MGAVASVHRPTTHAVYGRVDYRERAIRGSLHDAQMAPAGRLNGGGVPNRLRGTCGAFFTRHINPG